MFPVVTFPVVARIADQVESRWAAERYRPERFPAVAAAALREHEPPDFPAIAAALSGGLELPRQRRLDQSFGQPALTLHHGERFVVEALCWHTGSPAIHQHSFSGAFRVTTGRSVHGRYRFTTRERLADGVTAGDLELIEVRVLDAGSVTAIPAGADLIHSAFHLDNPSMTVIVRTHDTGEPEYTYLPPGLAYDPAARGETLHKRLQLLDTLHHADHPSYRDCVELALDSTGLYEGMEVLLRIHNHRLPPSELDDFTARFVKRQGEAARTVVEAVREQRRRSYLLAHRATVRDPDVRYVLACLLNAFDRGSFVRQLELGPPGARDSVATCLRHVLGMTADIEPVLGLAVTALLGRLEPDAFGGWVAERAGEPVGDEQRRLLTRLYRQLLANPLLTPLHT
jgi:hypothetical protein